MQNPSPIINKSSLSDARVRLTELMQRINYGRIENLSVRCGEPVFNPPPRIVREIKFNGENGPRPELTKHDFPLKAQVRELFEQMEIIGSGLIVSIEIQRGLPFRMTIAEEIRA